MKAALTSALLLAHATSAFVRFQPQMASPRLAAAVAEPELVAIDESLFVDEAAALARSTFPLSADEMITLAKRFISSRGGLGADPELLAESFVFEGPVATPVAWKSTFHGAFDLHASFMTSTGVVSRNDGRGWLLFRI